MYLYTATGVVTTSIVSPTTAGMYLHILLYVQQLYCLCTYTNVPKNVHCTINMHIVLCVGGSK